MDIDQHVTADRLENAGALDLTRLEHDVTVGQDDRPPPFQHPFEHIERSRIEPVRERVVYQVRRHCQKVYVLRVFDSIALQCAEIIAVAELGEQLFENRPVTVAACSAELAFQVPPQIGLDAVVVEQCVIHIDEEDDRFCGQHTTYLSAMP